MAHGSFKCTSRGEESRIEAMTIKEDTGLSANLLEIIEEAPAPGLSMELKKDLAEKAVAAAKAVN